MKIANTLPYVPVLLPPHGKRKSKGVNQ